MYQLRLPWTLGCIVAEVGQDVGEGRSLRVGDCPPGDLHGPERGLKRYVHLSVTVGRGKGDDVSVSNATVRASFTVPRLGHRGEQDLNLKVTSLSLHIRNLKCLKPKATIGTVSNDSVN